MESKLVDVGTGSKKALYIFLSSVLGQVTFVLIHRSSALILESLRELGIFDLSAFLPTPDLNAFSLAVLVALWLLGGWYGAWLGLQWYRRVYEICDTRGVVACAWEVLTGKRVVEAEDSNYWDSVEMQQTVQTSGRRLASKPKTVVKKTAKKTVATKATTEELSSGRVRKVLKKQVL